MVIVSNEDVAAALLLTLHSANIEETDKQDIVTNISFEAIVSSIIKCFFNQSMVNFLDKLELSDQNVRLMKM